jgi:hypothetical protein
MFPYEMLNMYTEKLAPGDFRVVWLPDTSGYTNLTPSNFYSQTQWIADHRDEISIVLHVGDVVQHGSTTPAQWAVANTAIGKLDTWEVPYLLNMGNHDYDDQLAGADRPDSFWQQYFPQSRYTAHSWFTDGGFFEANKSQNLYLIREGVLYINLEFGPRQAVIEWANALLTLHSNKLAIITTHAYMYRDNSRIGTGDDYNPHTYGVDADCHDGDELWTELVKLHDNLLWVQCGHDFVGGVAYRSDNSDGGAKIHQVMANYEMNADNGGAYLRIVTFKQSLNLIDVKSYSPVAKAFLTAAANQYVVDMR